MKILIVSDAWFPQVNGVVTTLNAVLRELQAIGHEVGVLHPGEFVTVPCPTYPEIRLAVSPMKKVRACLDSCRPEAVHIATEGHLGLAVRHYCLKRGLPFTTSFHTRFPEYIEARTMIPAEWSYHLVRWFHAPASRVMVAALSVRRELERRGFKKVVKWSRGVNTDLFKPRPKKQSYPRPIFLYVGRVAIEKNLKAFLDIELKGTKLVVGDGPQLKQLKKAFPKVRFLGAKFGEELAQVFSDSDAFVFPSRTDTFGLVLLEALASGIPVAAYPVTGPIDVVGNSGVGVLNEDLRRAALACLEIDPAKCRAHALNYSWKQCAQLFFNNLQPIARPASLISLQ